MVPSRLSKELQTTRGVLLKTQEEFLKTREEFLKTREELLRTREELVKMSEAVLGRGWVLANVDLDGVLGVLGQVKMELGEVM